MLWFDFFISPAVIVKFHMKYAKNERIKLYAQHEGIFPDCLNEPLDYKIAQVKVNLFIQLQHLDPTPNLTSCHLVLLVRQLWATTSYSDLSYYQRLEKST
jgi:hypothetical protein